MENDQRQEFKHFKYTDLIDEIQKNKKDSPKLPPIIDTSIKCSCCDRLLDPESDVIISSTVIEPVIVIPKTHSFKKNYNFCERCWDAIMEDMRIIIINMENIRKMHQFMPSEEFAKAVPTDKNAGKLAVEIIESEVPNLTVTQQPLYLLKPPAFLSKLINPSNKNEE